MITHEQIVEWRKLQSKGMVSAIGEYTPAEFWDLLNEVEKMQEGYTLAEAIEKLESSPMQSDYVPPQIQKMAKKFLAKRHLTSVK